MNIAKRKQAFGAIAKDYQKYRGTYDKRVYELLTSLIKKLKKYHQISLLDLGCGTGISTEPLVKIKSVSVIGCDPDIKMLGEAKTSARKKKLQITYIQGTAENLPFLDNTFNGVTSAAAFHWFANLKAMKEVRRVLKPQGVFFVYWKISAKSKIPAIGSDVYKKYKWHGIPHKLRIPENVVGIFRSAGFKKIKIEKISYIDKRTLKDALNLIKTSSEYSLLSLSNRKNFIKEMTVAYKKFLSDKDTVISKKMVCICYGFK